MVEFDKKERKNKDFNAPKTFPVPVALNRIKNNQTVSLEERIFLNKLSSVSAVVSEWVASALGPEASSIDND